MRFAGLTVLCSIMSSVLWCQSQDPVVMVFAGDVTLARHIETAVGEKTEYIFQRWNPVKPFDVFMVNLENAITTSDEKIEKEFNFKMPPKFLRILQNGGVNIVNAANNHLADYGRSGIYETMRNLDSVGIQYVGVGKNLREARKPVLHTVRGKTIGFLGYHGGDTFAATTDSAGLAPRFQGFIVEDVEKLQIEADYVVVNFHWGTELEEYPEQWQIDLAHHVVEAGADLIIGHHPHILQGIERYRGATIAYSLGNFIFGGNARHTYDTAVLKVVLAGGEPGVELMPVSVIRWQPQVSTADRAETIFNTVRERSAIFQESLVLTPIQAK